MRSQILRLQDSRMDSPWSPKRSSRGRKHLQARVTTPLRRPMRRAKVLCRNRKSGTVWTEQQELRCEI